MKPQEFKLAMIQMEVRGGDKKWNVGHALELIAEAVAHGTQVALLPECLDLGWTHPSSLTQAESIPEGGVCTALRQAAVQHSIIFVPG